MTQCRAITPGGAIVEITPAAPVRRTFAKSELEGLQEAAIYVFCEPHAKEAADGPSDDFNPQMQTERRPAYRIALQVSPIRLPTRQCAPRSGGKGTARVTSGIPNSSPPAPA